MLKFPVVFSAKCEEPFNAFICYSDTIEAESTGDAQEIAMQMFNEPPDTPRGKEFTNVMELYNVPMTNLQWQDWKGPWYDPGDLGKDPKFKYVSRDSNTYKSNGLNLYVGILIGVNVK